MSKRTKSTFIILAGIVVLLIAGLSILGKIGTGTPVRTAEVKKSSIEAYVEERGRTSLPHIYHITMPQQGRILPITLNEGDFVNEGDTVARLDDADWQDRTRETVNIIIATENWIDSVEAQVKASRIWQEYAKWEWEADAKLREDSFVSEKQERESRRRYLDANVQVEESLAMLHMGLALKAIVDIMPGYVKRNLDRTHVVSPVSGTVLKRHVWNERVMNPGEPLLDIGNLDELEISIDVLTEEAVMIRPGDRVEIFGDVIGDEVIEGEVRLIEPEAFTKVSSLGVEEQRVTVKVNFTEDSSKRLEDQGKKIGLEYRVRARIITDTKEQTSIIPRTALFHGARGQWQVYRIAAEKALLTDVEIGLMNDYEAEIISGLKEGEIVIVAPESSINDGMKVKMLER